MTNLSSFKLNRKNKIEILLLIIFLHLFISSKDFPTKAYAHFRLKVLAPKYLVKELKTTSNASTGNIPGTTATFGSPYYGEVILGKLLYFDSPSNFCKLDIHDEAFSENLNKTFTASSFHFNNSTSNSDNSLNNSIKNVFVIRRGGCVFVKKVRNAQRNNAHAVIIVDSPNSPWNNDDIPTIILSDNGQGKDIKIPTVMISNQDGEKLIKAIRVSENNTDANVYAELVWDIPSKDVVDVDFWTDSGNHEGRNFLVKFAPYAKELSGHLRFMVHHFIFSLPRNFDNMCWFNSSFCAHSPTTPGSDVIHGKDVLLEDLRQLCIYNITAHSHPVFPNSQYSLSFWDYLQKWGTECVFNGTSSEFTFGEPCSTRVMKKLKIDADKVKNCMDSDQGKYLLQKESEDIGWNILAMRINEFRFSGELNPRLAAKAICSAFEAPPPPCSLILNELPLAKHNPLEGNSFLVKPESFSGAEIFILLFFFLIVVTGGGLYFYQWKLRKHARDSLREEVMMEVRTQMQEYHQMHDEVSEGHRESRPLIF